MRNPSFEAILKAIIKSKPGLPEGSPGTEPGNLGAQATDPTGRVRTP